MVALWLLAALLLAVALRAPLGLAMLATGALGYAHFSSAAALAAHLATAWPARFMSHDLAMVPLFVLMGHLATRGGLSAALFAACRAWIGHWRGGLAMAAVAGCALFGAISGSSVATASTMARVALPEMRRHGYGAGLACGTLTAGGTLGILIPPSVVLILYALLTEQNIVTLFLAALLPGLLAVAGFVLAIAVTVRIWPDAAPRHPPCPSADRWRSFRAICPAAGIFALVLGGLYGGLFTPAEAACLGVVLTALAGIRSGELGWAGLRDSLLDTAVTSAMIFVILFGADMVNVMLALSQLPQALTGWAGAAGLPPMAVLGLVLLAYLAAGCVLDSLSLVLLTVPVVVPMLMALDFGLSPDQQGLWLGVLMLMAVELGMITPPVGLNLFVIAATAPEVPAPVIFRGTLPFLAVELLRLLLLLALPGLSTLPLGGPG